VIRSCRETAKREEFPEYGNHLDTWQRKAGCILEERGFGNQEKQFFDQGEGKKPEESRRYIADRKRGREYHVDKGEEFILGREGGLPTTWYPEKRRSTYNREAQSLTH